MHCVICKGALSGVLHCKGCSVQISCCSEECARANWSRSHQYECGQKIGKETDVKVNQFNIPKTRQTKVEQTTITPKSILLKLVDDLNSYKEMSNKDILTCLKIADNDYNILPDVIHMHKRVHEQNALYSAVYSLVTGVQKKSHEDAIKLINDMNTISIMMHDKVREVMRLKTLIATETDEIRSALIENVMERFGYEFTNEKPPANEREDAKLDLIFDELFEVSMVIMKSGVSPFRLIQRHSYTKACGFDINSQFEGTEWQIQERIDQGEMEKPIWWDGRYDELFVLIGDKQGPVSFPHRDIDFDVLHADDPFTGYPTDFRSRLTILFSFSKILFGMFDPEVVFIGMGGPKKEGCWEKICKRLRAFFVVQGRTEVVSTLLFFVVACLTQFKYLKYTYDKTIKPDAATELALETELKAAMNEVKIRFDQHHARTDVQTARLEYREQTELIQNLTELCMQGKLTKELDRLSYTAISNNLNNTIVQISNCNHPANQTCSNTTLMTLNDSLRDDLESFFVLVKNERKYWLEKSTALQYMIDPDISTEKYTDWQLQEWKGEMEQARNNTQEYDNLLAHMRQANEPDHVPYTIGALKAYFEKYKRIQDEPEPNPAVLNIVKTLNKKMAQSDTAVNAIVSYLEETKTAIDIEAKKKIYKALRAEGKLKLIDQSRTWLSQTTDIQFSFSDLCNDITSFSVKSASGKIGLLGLNLIATYLHVPSGTYAHPLEQEERLLKINELNPSIFNVAMLDTAYTPRLCHYVISNQYLFTMFFEGFLGIVPGVVDIMQAADNEIEDEFIKRIQILKQTRNSVDIDLIYNWKMAKKNRFKYGAKKGTYLAIKYHQAFALSILTVYTVIYYRTAIPTRWNDIYEFILNFNTASSTIATLLSGTMTAFKAVYSVSNLGLLMQNAHSAYSYLYDPAKQLSRLKILSEETERQKQKRRLEEFKEKMKTTHIEGTSDTWIFARRGINVIFSLIMLYEIFRALVGSKMIEDKKNKKN